MADLRNNHEFEDSEAVSVTSRIMVAAIIVLFLTVVFVVFLHLYSKWFWRRNGAGRSQSRRRFVFGLDRDSALAPRRGLDPAVIRALPVLIYQAKDFKEGLECAVCLCELSDGEKARLLPKCNHGFHLECIDMWFQSHSTCPLCRSAVDPESAKPDLDTPEIQVPEANTVDVRNFPTNVLFWGTLEQVSRSEEGTSSSNKPGANANGSLVIDIPRQLPESFSASSSPSVRFPAEEEVKSPTLTRLRSLKRLLSREKRVFPASPRGIDIVQGIGTSVQGIKMPADS